MNNVIWSRIPKRVFVEISTLRFGVYDAVTVYNKGNLIKCEVLKRLGLKPGCFTKSMAAIDSERIRNAEKVQNAYENKLPTEKSVKRKLSDDTEDPDNPSYAAGMF